MGLPMQEQWIICKVPLCFSSRQRSHARDKNGTFQLISQCYYQYTGQIKYNHCMLYPRKSRQNCGNEPSRCALHRSLSRCSSNRFSVPVQRREINALHEERCGLKARSYYCHWVLSLVLATFSFADRATSDRCLRSEEMSKPDGYRVTSS